MWFSNVNSVDDVQQSVSSVDDSKRMLTTQRFAELNWTKTYRYKDKRTLVGQ